MSKPIGRGRDDADEQLAAARERIAARDPTFSLIHSADAERKAWRRVEEARATGASAEHLQDLTHNAVARTDTVKRLQREAYENSCRRR